MAETIIVKLSGEHIQVDPRFGLVLTGLEPLVAGLAALRREGYRVGLVTGGGNISRGRYADERALREEVADTLGIMGTIINAVLLSAALEDAGLPTRVYTATSVPLVGTLYDRRAVLRDLADDKIVVFGGGIACRPYSTDVAAALYASELDARCVFKGTNVAGLFDGDPRNNPNARHIPRIGHAEYLSAGYTVLDASAVALCLQRNIEIVIYDTRQHPCVLSLLQRVRQGEQGEGFSVISSEAGA